MRGSITFTMASTQSLVSNIAPFYLLAPCKCQTLYACMHATSWWLEIKQVKTQYLSVKVSRCLAKGNTRPKRKHRRYQYSNSQRANQLKVFVQISSRRWHIHIIKRVDSICPTHDWACHIKAKYMDKSLVAFP